MLISDLTSRLWRAQVVAERALTEFDAAHPEVVAKIKADKAAAADARLAGVDIMGI